MRKDISKVFDEVPEEILERVDSQGPWGGVQSAQTREVMLNHICHRATGAVISQRLSYSLNSNLIIPKIVSLSPQLPS